MRIHLINCGLGIGFLIEQKHGLFLIDCGSPGQQNKVIQKMNELGRTDLRLIWITHAHYDHYGSADSLRKMTGAKIGIHPLDAGSMREGQSPLGTFHRYGFIYPPGQAVLKCFRKLPPAPPDFTLADGETLEKYGLEAVVLFTPGHTPGHSCLLTGNGVVFAGDLLGGSPRMGLQNLLATDWNLLPQSLEKVKAAHPSLVYTGHSRHPVPGDTLQGIESTPAVHFKFRMKIN